MCVDVKTGLGPRLVLFRGRAALVPDPEWSGDEFGQPGHGISSSQRFEGNSKAYTVFFLHRGTEAGTQPVQGMVPRGRDRQQTITACGSVRLWLWQS